MPDAQPKGGRSSRPPRRRRAALAAAFLLAAGVVAGTGAMAGRWWVDQATLVDLPSADAASEGIDPGALGALAERMAGKHRSKAFLVARRGSLVLERRCLDETLRPNLAAAPAGDVKADQPAPVPAAGWWSNANGQASAATGQETLR